ncbi:type III-B CRISPR module RAMP protein Cmr1 [Pyxidicoccus sp. 3LFB2]
MGSSDDKAARLASEDASGDAEYPEPAPRQRRYAGGPALESRTVSLKSTTPILGGAPVPRQVDTVDFIRVPTLRGHLRFWWRALYAHECRTSSELATRERALWGGVGSDEGTRSRVELRVEVDHRSARKDPQLDIQMNEPGAYALWPARATTRGEIKPAAPRWLPGLGFQLHLRAPAERMGEVENALRAWVLWGGYGSRARRGLGGFTVTDELPRWLPRDASMEALRELFPGVALFGAPPEGGARQVPLLRGARLFRGQPQSDGERAWIQALKWLRDFRQGQPPGAGKGPARAYAREWGDPKRPGRSNWPEPDYIRRLLEPSPTGKWAHPPRTQYSKGVAWARGGFGLPIGIRFQDKDRTKVAYRDSEPGDVELRWHDGKAVRERLASPLIVKAMPLAKGGFVPIALWLCRAWPEKGTIVLLRKGQGQPQPVPGSHAPFGPLVAPGDTALFAPLEAGNLQEAFFGWLKSHPGVREV